MNSTETSQEACELSKAHSPGKAALIVICFLASAFLAAAVMSCSRHVYIICAPVFALAAAFYGIALYYLRHPAIIILPLTVSAICLVGGASVITTAVIVSSTVVLSAHIALCTMQKTHLAAFFTGCALIASVLVCALMYIELTSGYGSVHEGLSAITESVRDAIPQGISAAELEPSAEEAAAAAAGVFLSRASLFIPAAVSAIAIITAYLTFGALALISLVLEIFPTFFGRPFRTPGTLGFFYLILALAGLFMKDSSGLIYYLTLNLKFSLMLLFAGDGVRRFIALFRISHNQVRAIEIATVTITAIFAPGILLSFAALVGANVAIIDAEY